ncbi:MAG TPA: glycogen/starch/alpha-glucan phosphorylase [Acetobacteraceae bacterium]|nr:glycogen/starch/alpha-glucan phosphorylase [Acetobacteraceae bacterium]
MDDPHLTPLSAGLSDEDAAPPAAAAAGALPDPVEAFRNRVVAKLTYQIGKDPVTASERDWFLATALAVRDLVVDRWMASTRATYETGRKRVYYMSLEFLIGRLLFDALNNLGLTDTARAALADINVDLDRIRAQEPDAALGNGGLGRLAACYMESMATLAVAAYGYGIRYELGLFRQMIQDGVQRELPEDWLSFGNPWEFERPEASYEIGFGGHVSVTHDEGHARYVWHPSETITAVAYDTPIVGWRGAHVNTLRLWSARANSPLQLEEFNRGDHVGAYGDRARVEAISRVLYPSDETPSGKELRLRQEFFFASASLQDLLRRHLGQFGTLANLPDKVAIQLNDTHPAIGIAEMLRLLLDVHGLGWDEAWRVTQACFAYTNHTLLPEALEMWPVPLLERLLPRHMQLIYLINARHLDHVRRGGDADDELLATASLIDEHHGRRVRMGHLAFVGSHRINGVSALHTELMRGTVFRDLNALYPGRIVNKTNGIAFRRWLMQANPGLTRLLRDVIGDGFLDDAEALQTLAAHAGDAGLHARLIAERRRNKAALANLIGRQLGIAVDPTAMFDVQIKRIHEYKRQLLNILHTVALYNAMRAQPMRNWVPRVKLMAGKAAPGYHRAKRIIRLAHDVARVINDDPTVSEMLKFVFLPNYNVSLAEMIIPAADLSEQISTAGTEASGTGNMKLALNGALTIGTLDGANVEIRDRVGADNIFIFGLTAEEVDAKRRAHYNARRAVEASDALAEVLDAIASGVFSPEEPDRYRDLIHSLYDVDAFMVTADFDSYVQMQMEVAGRWRQPGSWWQASVHNTANVGWFSADRAIRDYAADVWDAPVP